MNKAALVGRLVRDPEVRYSQNPNGQMAVAKFTLAVDRRFKKENEPDADFISCIAFGKNGEFVEKYFHKGMKVGVIGHIQTGSYENKDGQKVYTTDIIVEEQEFCESKNASNEAGSNQSAQTQAQASNDGFMTVPDDGFPEDLPFK